MHICNYLTTSSDTFCVRRSNNCPDARIASQARKELEVAQQMLENPTASGRTIRVQQNVVQTLKSVLSSLRCLPPEILLEIAFYFKDEYPCHKTESPLWRFSRVCKKWRAVALSSKQLWTTVIIDSYVMYSDYPLEGGAENDILAEYLRRSGDAPLQIRAKFEGIYDVDITIQRKLINILISHSHRWKTLHFTASDYLWPEMRHIRGRIPILECITCISLFESELPSQERDKFFPIFSDAPMLQSVDVMMDEPIPFILPWNQLTHYRDNYDGLRSRRGLEDQFFRGYERLRECSILSRTPAMSTSQSLLPDLNSLVLASPASLKTITAPALQSLMLYYKKPRRAAETIVVNMNVISHFIYRSSCSLTVLVLSGNVNPEHDIKGDDLVPLLEACPRLVQLHVYVVDLQAHFLQCLTLSPTSGVVPMLADLTLDASSLLAPNIGFLLSVLESRLRESTVLREVSVKGPSTVIIPDDLLGRFISLRQSGFRLHIGVQDMDDFNCESLPAF
ncbi:uncharacterized protein EV420DRAFT_1553228 [Desarmillaria tabescens]|uniref:F-box domain-containing protein n=1 Tax=Armillaria tabescens TaxID=1929756 RepID=A0AA39K735_ARMTA|nr:uncharacterized protein EV420DRAFT_1553228 [Desarmillaria tabescens]KAK0455781.1 hypothetical protein EV420DRAFT_1553228 [Desarmillaria tabescens]